MMQSFISSDMWIMEQNALPRASYLQGRSCARGHVELAVLVAIACLRLCGTGADANKWSDGDGPSLDSPCILFGKAFLMPRSMALATPAVAKVERRRSDQCPQLLLQSHDAGFEHSPASTGEEQSKCRFEQAGAGGAKISMLNEADELARLKSIPTRTPSFRPNRRYHEVRDGRSAEVSERELMGIQIQNKRNEADESTLPKSLPARAPPFR
ncbi:hypothetical protein RJ640_001963 [Escallonia rubra]|uniref:Uncharacterized protein n=1 Tax=Escallonia rubra TaxID=112253 RepID=A0AA88UE46_9ASTE|nr:hypothetical protein RJ640_001963 [Escallonia rubra]